MSLRLHEIAEPFWISEPPAEALTTTEIRLEDFTSLVGTADSTSGGVCSSVGRHDCKDARLRL